MKSPVPVVMSKRSRIPMGSIETTRDWSQYPKNWLEMRLGQIPMKKIGRVDDIAMACVYLAGDSGSYISGQVIHLNGGQFMSH